MRNNPDEYPGRTIKDGDRSPFGLGWEFARRGWNRDDCPFISERGRASFRLGFDRYHCTDRRAQEAMLAKGVPITCGGNDA